MLEQYLLLQVLIYKWIVYRCRHCPSGTTGEIRATHDVTAYYSSDANLKTNVVNIENALDKVQTNSRVEFDWTQEYIDDKGEKMDTSQSTMLVL